MTTPSEELVSKSPIQHPTITPMSVRVTSIKSATINHGTLFDERDPKKIEMYKNRPSRKIIEGDFMPRQPCLTIHTCRSSVFRDEGVPKEHIPLCSVPQPTVVKQPLTKVAELSPLSSQ